ncbi:MAG: S8 family serine peptidase [Tenericutes bacterium]|nr:S8 family serine peptidase [Mycoplasmatota bacterium]
MKKILKLLFISSLLLFGVTSIFFSYPNEDYTNESIELLYKVNDEYLAQEIAIENELELVSFSTYGFATYQTNHQSQIDQLVEKGFIYNKTSKIVAPPWQEPGDPLLGDQYAIELMGVNMAWTFTEGSADITIAIIDTGIDTDHDEFTGRLSTLSYNSRTKQVGLAFVEDDNGHGTAITGVIGANKDNSKGIAGIVQNSVLLVIKANNLDDPDTTEVDESKQFSDSAIIEGIYYAVNQGADIINLSLGGTYANPLTEDAIEYARLNDVIVVAASGNDGTNEKLYPASFEGVISVGAVDETSTIWDTAEAGSNYNDKVDLTAPGVSIVTTGLNNQYVTSTGTSLAAPQVTGVLGLMLSYFTDLSDDQIISQLLNTAIDQGDPGYDIYYGYGVVHAYQALQVEEVTITFETYGGTTIDPITVLVNQTFEVDDPFKSGHSFQGWYYDESFEFEFLVGVDTTNVNLTLYAKYQKNIYDVTFITEGTNVESISVLYGETFDVTTSELEGHDFIGWYYDIDYINPYANEPVVDHLTLYAKFTKSLYTVTYYIDNEVDSFIEVLYGETFEPMIPEGEFAFLGWYLDTNFTNPYEIQPVTNHLNLYARFDDGLYTVIFYDSDQTTVLQQNNVYYGSEVDAPTEPTKASTPSFDFIFESWSEAYDYIIEDTFIYPVFSKVYKPESIYLLPGVDTIYADENWNDGDIYLIDTLLTYEVRGEVDINLPGRYTIYYDIYDNENVIDTKVRMVRVVEKEVDVVITLNPDITTIHLGDKYVDQGATTNLGEITKTGDVNTNEVGVYIITYEVIYQNQSTTKTKYVYVIEQNIPLSNLTAYIKKEQEVWFL